MNIHLKPQYSCSIKSITLVFLVSFLSNLSLAASTKQQTSQDIPKIEVKEVSVGDKPVIAKQSNDVDRVIAVVNREVITQRELEMQIKFVKNQYVENKQPLPAELELEKRALNQIVNEKIMYQEGASRGMRVPDIELNGIIDNQAIQAKLSTEDFKKNIESRGIKFSLYRENLRREVVVARLKEREVDSKVKVTDEDVENYLQSRLIGAMGGSNSQAEAINLAQLLIPVLEGATAQEVELAKEKGEKFLSQATLERDFLQFLSRVTKEDPSLNGQNLGYRTLDRLPQIFVDAAENLSPGQVYLKLIKTPAGFHIIKLLDRKGGKPPENVSKSLTTIKISENEIRHLLVLNNSEVKEPEVLRRLNTFRDQVRAKVIDFGSIAKKHSEDGTTAPNGGYIGWRSPGQLPPEMEIAISKLNKGEISDPIKTDYGWHLIQLINHRETELNPSQQKEIARANLRQSKLQQALINWVMELRDTATIELREPYTDYLK